MFLVSQVLEILGISLYSKLYTNLVFHLLKIREFSYFFQILLNLFEILNIFYDNIWVNKENMSDEINNLYNIIKYT